MARRLLYPQLLTRPDGWTPEANPPTVAPATAPLFEPAVEPELVDFRLEGHDEWTAVPVGIHTTFEDVLAAVEADVARRAAEGPPSDVALRAARERRERGRYWATRRRRERAKPPGAP